MEELPKTTCTQKVIAFTERRELGEVLRQLPSDQGIFVQVYDRVPVGFAVAALQEATDAGFSQVTYVPSE